MSDKPQIQVNVEDVYALLSDVHAIAVKNNEILTEVKDLLDKVPQAMEQISKNPMFKMLGL